MVVLKEIMISVFRCRAGLVFTLSTCLVAWAGFYRMFFQFGRQDDEGLLLYALKNFIGGRALYDAVFTQYGPAYFLLHTGILLGRQQAVTHDALRMVSLLFWCLGSLFLGLFVYTTARERVSDNTPAVPHPGGWCGARAHATVPAVVTMLVSFAAVGLIVREPAHPQAMIYFLTALGVFLIARVNRPWGMVLMGIAAGLVLCTKINAGIFIIAAILWVISGSFKKAEIRIAVCAVMIFMPYFLMRQRMDVPVIAWYALIAVIVNLNLLLVLPRDLEIFQGFSRSRFLLPVSFLAVCCACAAGVLLRGTTITGLYQGMVAQHWSFAGTFWWDPYMTAGMAGCGLVSIIACAAFRKFSGSGAGFRDVTARVVPAMKFIFAAEVILLGIKARPGIGLEKFGGYLLPWMWLVMLPVADREFSRRQLFLRYGLLAAAAFQFLLAYPVAGTQMEFATVLLVPAAGILLSDVLKTLHLGRWREGVGRAYIAGMLAVYGLCGAAVYSVTAAGAAAAGLYHRRLPPAVLSGFSRLHIQEERLAVFEGVTLNIRQNARSLVTVPGMYSFCLWSGVDSPTLLNQTNWPFFFNEKQQARVVRDIAAAPAAVVVYNGLIRSFWARCRGPGITAGEDYIRDSFVPVISIRDYIICARGAQVGAFRAIGAWRPELEELGLSQEDERFIRDRGLVPVVVSFPPLFPAVTRMNIVDASGGVSPELERLPDGTSVLLRNADSTFTRVRSVREIPLREPVQVVIFARFPQGSSGYDSYVVRACDEAGRVVVRLPFITLLERI